MITPDEIHAKTFTETRFGRGYDQGEVDEFLDSIANQLKAQPVVTYVTPPVPAEVPVVPAPVAAPPTVKSIALLLENAQKAADQLTAEATQQAQVTVFTAQQQAKQLVDDATAKADALVADTAGKVAALKVRHADITARLKDALEKLGDIDQGATG